MFHTLGILNFLFGMVTNLLYLHFARVTTVPTYFSASGFSFFIKSERLTNFSSFVILTID